METIVEGRQVVKVFENSQINVLDGIDMTIKEGAFLAIMGPSGSGKSTLLHCLSAMDRISGGQVLFMGQDLEGLSQDQLADLRRQEMGFVFQEATMLKNLNILDNIVFPSLRDHKSIGDQRALLDGDRYLMDALGIGDLEDKSIGEVSGGQLQRAGICRSLMNRPKVIFADEPTRALNSRSAREVLDIFENINKKGMAILMVTHDPNVAARAQKLFFMKDGRLKEDLDLGPYKKKEESIRVDKIRDSMERLGI